MLNSLLENLSSLVFPAECEICGRALNVGPASGVCPSCASKIRWIPAPHCSGCGRTRLGQSPRCSACHEETYGFDRAFACAAYEGVMRDLLHVYKFKYRKHLKIFFTDLARQFILAHLSDDRFDAVLPVPSGVDRRLERGFNPPELISREIAATLNIPHPASHFVRTRSESAQALLAKTGRKQNVKGVFFVKQTGFFNSKRLLLIDDILTTGQTASECSKILKEAGASSVTVLALARGI